MAIKMTGAEYKRFMTDETLCGEDGYFDDAFLSVDGKEEDDIDIKILDDTAAMRIEGGMVFDLPGDREMSLEDLFRKCIKSIIKNNGGQAA